ncbi:MerR family transcriptional regulator [Nocardia wallacei]|uniref:MerR family transcriptional regulator n=1 Tax=Nocardia wallacei TaxID=480035 RepID=UPI002454F1AD|nr:MerR family transcriptional regulator [Nocardia wallacei]
MDDENLLAIGALAERTGVSVKTIRFYSDKGIVPPTCHSPAGYRLYDIAALARLELVRTLRELDIDLAMIRRVLDRETSLTEVAEAHAAALDVQVRVLRLRRAVLQAVAARALAADIAPESASAADIVDTLTARYADTFGRTDDDRLRRWVLERLAVANDPRVTRYWQLVATINDWPPLPYLEPVFTWFGRALHAHPGKR